MLVRVRLPGRDGGIRAGRALAWGFNGFGELGTGNKRTSTRPVPVKLPRGTRIKAISAAATTTWP